MGIFVFVFNISYCFIIFIIKCGEIKHTSLLSWFRMNRIENITVLLHLFIFFYKFDLYLKVFSYNKFWSLFFLPHLLPDPSHLPIQIHILPFSVIRTQTTKNRSKRRKQNRDKTNKNSRKKRAKEKAQETHTGMQTHTNMHTWIPQNHKTRTHNTEAKVL